MVNLNLLALCLVLICSRNAATTGEGDLMGLFGGIITAMAPEEEVQEIQKQMGQMSELLGVIGGNGLTLSGAKGASAAVHEAPLAVQEQDLTISSVAPTNVTTSDSECPEGRTGTGCGFCDDGYYGEPEIHLECEKCDCSNNVDEHAIGNCDRVTGECLKCIFDTAGWNCDYCKEGFHGDALAPNQMGQEQNCQPCNCYPKGSYLTHGYYGNGSLYETNESICDDLTGQCPCMPNVVGQYCDRCEDGYFNIDSGQGCDPCDCHYTGSYNWTCDAFSGQCDCRPGITGQRCDQCEPNHYSLNGWMDHCTPCNCDPSGSVHLQCDRYTGQCPCKDKVGGRMCDNKCVKDEDCNGGKCDNNICRDYTDEEIQGWQGSSLLRKAAEKGNLDEVKQLVERGANVKDVDYYGYNAIQKAAGKGHVEVVKYLHSHGADILTGLSPPFWLAAHHGHLPVVEYLADNGAPLDTPSGGIGQFPLNAAVDRGNVDVVRFLIERGADVNKKTEAKWGERTNLEIARKHLEWAWGSNRYKKPLYEEIITLLIDAGAQEA